MFAHRKRQEEGVGERMIQKVPLSILAILQRSWAARSWIRARLQQAGNLTSAFQHSKTELVHPRKNHVGTDVGIYASRGNIKHTKHTHTRFSMPFCFVLAIHAAPIKSQSPIITISSSQKTSLMKQHTVIFRKPESCPNVLFDCPFDSLHHAERLGGIELWPLTPILL